MASIIGYIAQCGFGHSPCGRAEYGYTFDVVLKLRSI